MDIDGMIIGCPTKLSHMSQAKTDCNQGSDKVEASVRGDVAVGFDSYGCGNVSDGDDADVSTCGSWQLLHLTEASGLFRRYDG